MFPERFRDYNIILASGSPRRAELLAKLDIEFSVASKDVSEEYDENLNPVEIAILLARQKCSAVAESSSDNDVIIGADTIVVCDMQILNKPSNHDEAIAFLKFLSGKSHSVITGVAVHFAGIVHSFSTTTEVSFGNLDIDDINYYVAHYNPIDKAGAYGIQEWIGMTGVREIRGCYYNVMGLPLFDLYNKLKEILKSKN